MLQFLPADSMAHNFGRRRRNEPLYLERTRRLFVCLFVWLVGCLVGWLVVWFVCLFVCLVGCLFGLFEGDGRLPGLLLLFFFGGAKKILQS